MDKKRYLEQKVDQLLLLFPVVAVIGSRQCGKSTLVKRIRPDWKYYDLERADDYQLIANDPITFFELHSEKVIIDEVQQYPELFKTLRNVIDKNRNLKGRFLLTGSSSPEIVRGITESLAGRIATVEMWPFKQGEFYEQPLSMLYDLLIDKNTTINRYLELDSKISLTQSMHLWQSGGFPEPLIEGVNNPIYYNHWVENYISDYINRDIRSLFPRLNIHNFRRFLTLLSQFSGHQLNMSDISRALGISVSTVRDYLDIIHQTFVWRNLQSFTKNSLKKVQKSDKGFFRDQGLLHYLLKIQDLDQLQLHPVAGFSFESFVIEEIIRGIQSTMATQLDFNYYRTIDKSEVDLIIDGAFGTIPIEIKLSSSVNRKSLCGMENFIKDMDCKYGIVINRGKQVELISDTIVQIPVNFI